MRAKDPTALYRLRNALGELLYMGISRTPKERLRDHRRERRWWSEVDESKTTIDWFDYRADARNTEISAIAFEQPKYNIAETPLHRRVSGFRHELTEGELATWAASDTYSGRQAGHVGTA